MAETKTGILKEASKNIWAPVSSHAYGANALYIPCWGSNAAMELIVVLTQNYPTFKTHPALDIWKGYTAGAERFQHNHHMRVLGWRIEPSENYFSFLYLPEEDNSVRMLTEFTYNSAGKLQLRCNLNNQSKKDREWQLTFYFSPIYTEKLIGYKMRNFTPQLAAFGLNARYFRLAIKNSSFVSADICDSSSWINFPANVEDSSNLDNPISRAKQRIKIMTSPIPIPKGSEKKIYVDVLPSEQSKKTIPAKWPQFKPTKTKQLPYEHQWWETVHNQYYAKSYIKKNMVTRLLPARQWGKFYLWDAGMTLIGAVEKNCEFVQKHLSEMPDPTKKDAEQFCQRMGSFIPTAIFAWWELYCKNSDVSVLKDHYEHMKRLFLYFYSWPKLKPDDTSSGIVKLPNNRNGVDDYPPVVYCDGWPFAWEYKNTLPLNAERKQRLANQPGMTAIAIRFAKILRLAAHLLDKLKDVEFYSALIRKSEKALNTKLWNKKNKIYGWRTNEDGMLKDMFGIDGCYPLLSNSAPPKRANYLWEHLTDGKGMLTKYGYTVVPRNNKFYRDNGYWNGAVWLPPQWFIWKACYNHGNMPLAKKIAERLLMLWEKNHAQSLCCWEEFRVKTGGGAGNSRFSGLSTPILALQAALRQPGRVQFGHDVIVDCSVNKSLNGLNALLKAPFGPITTGLSVVLKPDCDYRVSIGSQRTFQRKTDIAGFLSLSFKIPLNSTVNIKITRKM